MRILIVDDDQLILDLISVELHKADFNDHIAVNSPLEAMALVEALDRQGSTSARAFDCFLLDIDMPEMSGIELCARIRSIPAYDDAPIIMVTSLTDRESLVGAYAAGANDYMNKPVEQIELVSRIRSARILVEEQRRKLGAYFLASALNIEGSDESGDRFRAPAALPNVKNVVDYPVLEKFLIQLEKNSFKKTVAVALKVESAHSIFEELGEKAYYRLMTDIAKSVLGKLGKDDVLVSHFGSGYLVCLANASNKNINPRLSKRLNRNKYHARGQHDSLEIGVTVSDAIQGQSVNDQERHWILVEAIDNVRRKALAGRKLRAPIAVPAPVAQRYRL